LGRFLPAFFFAFGRDGFFRFFAGFGRGADIGSFLMGAGAGGVGGAGGYIGSIIPEPVQLLSEKSVDASIGWSLLAGGRWAWPIAYLGNAVTQVDSESVVAAPSVVGGG
jgi:hypothetical protein